MNGTRTPRPIVLVILTLALVVGAWASLQFRAPSRTELARELSAVTLLPAERPLPELQFVNQDGATAGREVFAGHWTLLFMGFTSCGYICPTTMATLRTLQQQLNAPVQVVFVSVDPNRDTPDVIRQYVQNFDPGIIGLTGTPEQLDVLAGTLGAPYGVNTDPDDYTVDHSTAVFLISPDAGFAGVMTPPFEINALANDLNRVL